ncbi:MAG: hypothetical protein NTX63_00735 [Candidatus Peregrinibacteria bacterium]|nr:hypothetical protein [Candidatus Peregrinibacteria bacterium]
MHRKISGVRFTVSFLALLLVVFLSACSSAKVTTKVRPSSIVPSASTITAPVTAPVSPVSTNTTTPTTTKPTTTPAPKALTGTFHERVSYQTPESIEDVDFVFAVSSGSVTNLTLSSTPSERQSGKYQSRFMDAITNQVVGMKISDLGTFDRVGGASLTTDAFNQAVAQLKAQS